MIDVVDNSALLRNDVKKLGNILGEILVHHGGIDLFNKVEAIREMAKSLRNEYDENTYKQLKDVISSLEPPIRQQVIRAFSIYFHLINIAEQNHRIRRRRQYQLHEQGIQPFSLEGALLSVKENELSSDELERVLNDLSIELIITAHPTEAAKRTVLEIQKRISTILQQFENPMITKNERKKLDESLANEVTALWQTDELRHRKPKVLDEVKNGLYYFDQTLFETLPAVHQELELQLKDYFPDHDWRVPNFVHFGSWIGGDRDGNPNVTPEVTWETLKLQRQLVLKKYEESLIDLMKRFSQSISRVSVSEELMVSVERDEPIYLEDDERWVLESEVYRRKFAIMLKRLREVGKSELGYLNSQELEQDLKQVKKSAESHQPSNHKLKTIQKLIRQVQLFGFHLATLDIRNHSGEHETAVSELLKAVNITASYAELHEEEKVRILEQVLKEPRPLLLFEEEYSKETQEVLKVFKLIKKKRMLNSVSAQSRFISQYDTIGERLT